MVEAPIIPYGFGKHYAQVYTYQLGEPILRGLTPAEALCLLDIPTPDSLMYMIGALAPSLIIMPPVSPYSHLASTIWCSGIAVAAMDHPERLTNGEAIFVDFETGQLSSDGSIGAEDQDDGPQFRSRAVNRSTKLDTSQPPRIYSEITSLADGERALRDGAHGISIVKIEQLAGDPSGDFAHGLVALCDRFERPGGLKVRFYDDEAGLPVHLPSWIQPTRSLGMRGVRALGEPALQSSFLTPLITLREIPITIILPMLSTTEELHKAREQIAAMSPHWFIGATIETPSAALLIDELIDELAFVELGLNDLSQYTLGWDRNAVNPRLLPHDQVASAVAQLVETVCARCRAASVECMLGLDLRPNLGLAQQLAGLGVDAISCAPPLVPHWRAIWPS